MKWVNSSLCWLYQLAYMNTFMKGFKMQLLVKWDINPWKKNTSSWSFASNSSPHPPPSRTGLNPSSQELMKSKPSGPQEEWFAGSLLGLPRYPAFLATTEPTSRCCDGLLKFCCPLQMQDLRPSYLFAFTSLFCWFSPGGEAPPPPHLPGTSGNIWRRFWMP